MNHQPASRNEEPGSSESASVESSPTSSTSASSRVGKTLTGLGPAETPRVSSLEHAAARFEFTWAEPGTEEGEVAELAPWKSLLEGATSVDSVDGDEDASAALSAVVRDWAVSPPSLRSASLDAPSSEASDSVSAPSERKLRVTTGEFSVSEGAAPARTPAPSPRAATPSSEDLEPSIFAVDFNAASVKLTELAARSDAFSAALEPRAEDQEVEVPAVAPRLFSTTLQSEQDAALIAAAIEEPPRSEPSQSNEVTTVLVRSGSASSGSHSAPSSNRSAPTAEQRSSDTSARPFLESGSALPWSATVGAPAKPSKPSSLRSAGIAFVASVVATAVILPLVFSKRASLVLTDSSARPIAARVVVDGETKCQALPCRVEGLGSGAHTISATADGYVPVTQSVQLEGRDERHLALQLAPEASASLHVAATAPGLRVFVDGEDRGPAPLTLAGLTATSHTVRLAGSAFYAPFEERVVLKARSTLTFEPKLVVLKRAVRVTLGSGAQGAFLELSAGDQRHAAILEGPVRVELFAADRYRVRASRWGYRTYEGELVFGANDVERELRIELPLETMGTPGSPPGVNPLDPGKLSLNSIPISTVLLDGQHIGSTPIQISTTPGTHSVIFRHPALGEKRLNVQVQPGKTALAATRF